MIPHLIAAMIGVGLALLLAVFLLCLDLSALEREVEKLNEFTKEGGER